MEGRGVLLYTHRGKETEGETKQASMRRGDKANVGASPYYTHGHNNVKNSLLYFIIRQNLLPIYPN